MRWMVATFAMAACGTPPMLQHPPGDPRWVEQRHGPPQGGTLDPDGDGVGVHDWCPTAREDIDGLEDGDGCPEVDADDDGVRDTEDGCPLLPEAPLHTLYDGCPDGTPGAASRR